MDASEATTFSRRSMRVALASLIVLAAAPATRGQMREHSTILESITVLDEIMQIPASAIPSAMLADAQAVAVIPRVIKGSFVVGARRGSGVVMARDDQGNWQAPVFVTLTGGNVGWQVGVQSTDVILVFKTRTSVQNLFSGKFTIGADAAAAAGPVGRNAAAATDGRLQAEVYSYSRSRGLFAGVSIDGSILKTNQIANATYYRSPGPGMPTLVPQEAVQLVQTLMTYTGEASRVPLEQAVTQSAATALPVEAQPAKDEASSVRDELSRVAPQLFQLLDQPWQTYLALPAEIFNHSHRPVPKALADCLTRFETVRADPQYHALAVRPEFQATYDLLKRYQAAQMRADSRINLPSPPSTPDQIRQPD